MIKLSVKPRFSISVIKINTTELYSIAHVPHLVTDHPEPVVLDNIIDLIEPLPNSVKTVAVLVSILDETGGAGSVAIRQLKLLRDSGYRPVAFTFDSSVDLEGIEIIELGDSSKTLASGALRRVRYSFWPFSLIKLAKCLGRYDLLIVHQPVFCFPAYVSKLLSESTTVYFNHHITEPNEKVGLARTIFGHTAYRAMLYTSSRLDKVVSVSDYSRSSYLERFSKDGPVIYNQIDKSDYNRDVSGAEIRERHQLHDNEIILFVGRVAKSKRIHELIDVYEDVLNTFPNAVLLLVGRVDNHEYMRQLQRLKRDSSGSIIFAGEVPESELPKYYASADVYATCSSKEGFNLTIAEAEACGTPTVAYDIGAHSEVLNFGSLVEPGRTEKFTQSIVQTLSK